MKIFTHIFLFSLFSLAFANNEDIPKEPVKLSIEIYKEKYLALNFESHPGWHIYWKNPGDAGLPISPTFFLNDNPIDLIGLEWPAPRSFEEQSGEINTYGYEGKIGIFYQLPDQSLNNQNLTVNVTWLACKNICIPGQKKIQGRIESNNYNYPEKENIFSPEEIEKNFNAIPKAKELPQDIDILLSKRGENKLVIFYNLKAPNNYPQTNIFYPLPSHPFNFRKEELFRDTKNNIYGKMEIDWDGEYSDPSEPLPADGNFVKPHLLKFLFLNPLTNEYELISKNFASFDLAGAQKLDELFKILTPVEKKKVSFEEPQTFSSAFWYYLLFAFLGGLLLNLMPCVLPVISLKIFYLIKHKKASRSVLIKHNLSYSLGIFFTFTILAIIVASLKATGEIIGWGFQLQSPQFLSVIIFILFIFVLNLFGLFQFLTPGGKFLGNIQTSENYFGDFLSGILTTILATPCSAPFLGTALTFAFTSNATNIFLIFGGIALGLAIPFLLIGLFPKLISFLPKPGQWMEGLKHFLGLTLLLTIVWLFDVFIQLNPPSHFVIYLGTSLSLIFFALFAKKHTSKNFILFIILLLLPGLIMGKLIFTSDLHKEGTETDIIWKTWSIDKMEELRTSNKFVFIDFTAKWCLTCKVNESLVLKTDSFKELAKKYEMELLLADWTKRDQSITDFLLANGKVGVPAYFIIDKKGKLIDLGETISIGEIEQNLK
jgi:thiol:disulfide interchange protein DsbD